MKNEISDLLTQDFFEYYSTKDKYYIAQLTWLESEEVKGYKASKNQHPLEHYETRPLIDILIANNVSNDELKLLENHSIVLDRKTDISVEYCYTFNLIIQVFRDAAFLKGKFKAERFSSLCNTTEDFDEEIKKLRDETSGVIEQYCSFSIDSSYEEQVWLHGFTYETFNKITTDTKHSTAYWQSLNINPFFDNLSRRYKALVLENLKDNNIKKNQPENTERTNRTDLRVLFEDAYKLDKWDRIIKSLKRNEKIDMESNKWMTYKNELAGTIRLIGLRYLEKTLSVKEVMAIAKTNFLTDLKRDSIKRETAKKWNSLNLEN